MLILALDTAQADCAACLFDTTNDVVLARTVETIGKGHAERLMAVIDETLRQAGRAPSGFDRIAVNVGPGSFTGVRVGVSTARALALATRTECVGVSSLSSLGFQARELAKGRAVMATIDARRGEAYAQVFGGADGEALTEPSAYAYEALDGLMRRHDALAFGTGASVAGLEVAGDVTHIEIETIARIGAVARPQGPVSPLYLRAPDARPQAGFAVARR
ncbi:tRNA threonylcarbamoyl adenosine modification protein YeaZ [Martelella radicis]|uniref:tRNA threonylcarbamoyl adenosine modification protein YeaZ n=1 Tax=Martelella radicis TaxID=1397476 RepID=A0A7W6KMF5_9HYPH|nr:tRNA (adenosine(37)-N6)-threonylcarbamoyltransferase complex dimerization subunit type 1 TsaB [Martelella radicis]MBB4123918.1 tRNA threonylcarbamoyl adenosine modification protein YeaZ [Martelella radicis]